MHTQPTNDEELRKEVLALKAKLDVRVAEAKLSRKRQTGNVFGIALLLAPVCLWIGWEFYHGRNPWRQLFDRSQWRHPVRDLVSVAIIVLFALYWLFDWLVSSRKQRQKIKAEADWFRTLDAKVDFQDFNDRDRLYDWLDPDERQKLIQELQRMPKGSRSLHAAVRIVSPELIDEPDEKSGVTMQGDSKPQEL